MGNGGAKCMPRYPLRQRLFRDIAAEFFASGPRNSPLATAYALDLGARHPRENSAPRVSSLHFPYRPGRVGRIGGPFRGIRLTWSRGVPRDRYLVAAIGYFELVR